MHYCLGITSVRMQRGSVGAEPLCVGTWRALEPCSPFPGSLLEPVWNQLNLN